MKKPAKASKPRKSQSFTMRADEEFLRRVDDWRRKQPDLPSRAEAIRRMVMASPIKAK